MEDIVHRLADEEIKLLKTLSRRRRERRAKAIRPALSFGERVSDRVAGVVGSWQFVIIQSVVMVVWLALNIVAWTEHWDPYPFILLNLVLSFQAAYTAPIILMSQNRQSAIDRDAAEHDYDVNLKAELEIELLHQKLDLLREEEIGRLIQIIERLEARLSNSPKSASETKRK
jgi:uncharacterized membrane protein